MQQRAPGDEVLLIAHPDSISPFSLSASCRPGLPGAAGLCHRAARKEPGAAGACLCLDRQELCLLLATKCALGFAGNVQRQSLNALHEAAAGLGRGGRDSEPAACPYGK